MASHLLQQPIDIRTNARYVKQHKMEDLLVATFERQELQDILWRYVDHIINIGATSNGIVVGIDKILCSIDEFCEEHGVDIIAPLYRELLSYCRCGELMGAKYISYNKDAWLKRFPNGPAYKTDLSDISTLQAYKEYLEQRNLSYELSLLNLYIHSKGVQI